MPAADSLPGPHVVHPREPARPHPPAAGPEQAAAGAPFSNVLSRALDGPAPGGATPSPSDPLPQGWPSAFDRSAHAATSRAEAQGEVAEKPHPIATAQAASAPGPAADFAPVPVAPVAMASVGLASGGAGPLLAVQAAAVGTAAADVGGVLAPRVVIARERGDEAPTPDPAVQAAAVGTAAADAKGALAPRVAIAREQEGEAPVPDPAVQAVAVGTTAADAKGALAPRVVIARERGDEAPAPPRVATPARPAPDSAEATTTTVGPVPGGAAVSPGSRSHGMPEGTHVPNAEAPSAAAVGLHPLDPSRSPGETAALPEQTAEAPPPAPRRTAARAGATSWSEEDPAQDATRATDPPSPPPAPPPLALVVALVPTPPAEPTAPGDAPRVVGSDGMASTATAAAAGGPPAPVPAVSDTPADDAPTEVSDTASAPEATGVPGTTDAPPPASPAAASPAVPPAADSAPLQSAAQPVPAAPSRPAELPHTAGHVAPHPAAEQVASVLVQVAGGPAAGGGQRMVVRLDPAELGKVEIRVERAEGGPAQVSLTVDRPETLLLLLRDQPGLHRALDQAGVPAEGRALQFQLAPAPPDPAPPSASADRGATPGWGGASDRGRGDGTWHGQGHGGQPGGRHRGHAPADTAGHGSYRAWRDAGLDITA